MSVLNSVTLRSLTAICVPVLQLEFGSHEQSLKISYIFFASSVSFLIQHIFAVWLSLLSAYIWDTRSNPFEIHAEGFDSPSIAPDNNDDMTPSFTGNNLDEDFYDLCVDNLKHKWNINNEHLGKSDSTTRTGLLQAVVIFSSFQAQ